NSYDLVCNIRGFLRIRVVDADLEKVGISHLVDLEFVSQYLISDFARQNATVSGPLLLQLQLLNDRIKNARALNHLVNSRRKLWIVDRLIRIPLGEYARILRSRFYFYENRRPVFTRLKLGKDCRADRDHQKRQQNDDPVDPDYAPIIEKMEFNFGVLRHTGARLLARVGPSLPKLPTRVNPPGYIFTKM